MNGLSVNRWRRSLVDRTKDALLLGARWPFWYALVAALALFAAAGVQGANP